MKVSFVFYSVVFTFLSFATEPILVVGDEENLSFQLGPHYGSQFIPKEQLEKSEHFDEILPSLPGLTSSGGTSRSRFFQVRGIGERSSYEGMPNESVTILFDEIDYTGVGGVLETFGVDNFEIYKGPQNTVIGPSALAGAIRSRTTIPSRTGLKTKVGAASFNGRSLSLEGQKKFSLGGTTLVGNYRESDGYFKNNFLGRKDTNDIKEFSLRTKSRFKNIELNFHYFNFENGYDVFNLNNSKVTQSEDPGKDFQKTLGMSLVHELKKSSWKLKSILSGHRTGSFYSYDEDWENSSSYDYRIEFDKDLRNLNLEERLSWDIGKVLNTTGIFFKNTHLSSRELGFNAEVPRKDLKATFKRRRSALFHESEFLLSDVTFFGGFRISFLDSTYFDSNNIGVDPNETLYGGHFGVKREKNRDYLSARLSRGFKAGGVNIGSNITANRRGFEEESLYQLDLIWKRDQDIYNFEVNFFANYRDNIQVKTSYQDNPSDPSSFTFYTDNGTSGISYGMEGSLNLAPLSFYEIKLSGNIMNSRYGDYVYGSRNLKNREFSYAPNYKISFSQNFKFLKQYSLQTEHILTDSFYFGNSHDEQSPKSLLTNFELSWIGHSWSASLWARNLFNERTETRGFFFGNRSPSFQNERFVQVGPPRIIGISLTMNL